MNEPDDLARRRRFRELVAQLGELLRRMPDRRAERLLHDEQLTRPERDEQRGAA